MSVKKGLLSVIGLAVLAMGFHLPAQAQTIEQESESNYLVAGDIEELAQNRRRRNPANREMDRGSDFVGIGANVGYVNDVSGVVISKITIRDRLSIRPSLSIGDDFAVLVPLTYDFREASGEVEGFQLRPYAGLGASWANENNNRGDDTSDLHLLLSAGVDVPVSRRFTVNAQANLGVFNDTEFGATVGVGYNVGNFFR